MPALPPTLKYADFRVLIVSSVLEGIGFRGQLVVVGWMLLEESGSPFIVGLGINRGLLDWAGKGAPLPKSTRNFYLAGIGLHAAFNTIGAVLWFAGAPETQGGTGGKRPAEATDAECQGEQRQPPDSF